MPIHSPLANPASWTLRVEPFSPPSALRYGGYPLRALRATRTGNAAVVAPTNVTLKAQNEAGFDVFELEWLPWPIASVARSLPFGLPTLYVAVAEPGGVSIESGDGLAAGEPLITAEEVWIAAAFSDRITREPAHWIEAIRSAAAEDESATWSAFAAEVAAQTDSVPSVLMLDHAGRPLRQGSFEIDPGANPFSLELTEADGGDLQRALTRTASPANPAQLLGAGLDSIRVTPLPGQDTGSVDFSLGGAEDGTNAEGTITVTRQRRHILLTDLHRWFAAQFANSSISDPADRLAAFSRGNRFRALIDGDEFFADFFESLDAVSREEPPAPRDPSDPPVERGLHHVGWGVDASKELGPSGQIEGFPRSLAEAAEAIAAKDGKTRVLAAEFLQLSDETLLLEFEAYLLFSLWNLALLFSSVEATKTDGGGFLAFALAIGGLTGYSAWKLSDDDARLEPNRKAVAELEAIDETRCLLSPVPAVVADNPLAPDDGGVVLDQVFKTLEHFNVFHQKLSIVRKPSGFVGYCGGMDLSPTRLDNPDHLSASPYHDVHARVEGPAVRDLALTFEQRWQRDAALEEERTLAFQVPSAASLVDPQAPGEDAVQVARTYFAPSDPARAFDFAETGDKTLLDTLILGIEAASEYIYIEDQYFTPPPVVLDALVRKLEDREIEKLILLLPAVADQPYGEAPRLAAIDALEAADVDGKRFFVGFPRRRYTVARNDTRASSGRLSLQEDLELGAREISLGPVGRLPAPPFWIAVGGEFMYVIDEALGTGEPADDSAKPSRRFEVLRGEETRLFHGAKKSRAKGPRKHIKGAPATVVQLDPIFVHSKIMMVDDVFASVGSANINRRGFYSDGEANLYCVPQALRAAADNPVRTMRKRLWADHLGLPASLATPLLDDPLAASHLFERSYLAGNRFVDYGAMPATLIAGVPAVGQWKPGQGVVELILTGLGFAATAEAHEELFDAVVDPSSQLETVDD